MTDYEGWKNLEAMESATNYNAHLLTLLKAHLPPVPANLLDFGAGLGSYARKMSNLGHKVRCVETDPKLRRVLIHAGLQTETTIEAFPARSFDLIYSLNVLEHIDDHIGALRLLRSRLSDRGTLLLYVPAFPVLYSSMDRRVGHFRRYTERSLRQALAFSGFESVSTTYVDSIGFLAAFAFRLVGSDSGMLTTGQIATYDRFVFPVSAICDRVMKRICGKNLFAVASPVGRE